MTAFTAVGYEWREVPGSAGASVELGAPAGRAAPSDDFLLLMAATQPAWPDRINAIAGNTSRRDIHVVPSGQSLWIIAATDRNVYLEFDVVGAPPGAGVAGHKGSFPTRAALDAAVTAPVDGDTAWLGARLVVYNAAALDWLDQSLAETSVSNETLDAVTAGQPLYTTATGKLRLAQADASATASVVGLARASAAANVGVTITTENLSLADWTAVVGAIDLAPSAIYFLDPLTPGRLTTVAPTVAGQFVVRVGRAITARMIAIDASEPYLIR